MSTVNDILTSAGYRTLHAAITSSTEVTAATCMVWMNEDVDWLLGLCAEEGSDIGQIEGSLTTVDGTASYGDFDSDLYAPADYGWIEEADARTEIYLTARQATIGYNPGAANEGQPEQFYVTGANQTVLLPTPDAVYTVKIPYWQTQESLTKTGDAMPFQGLFDNVLIEALVIRIQNRDEYSLDYEKSWLNFLTEKARNLIRLRNNTRGRLVMPMGERFLGENLRNEKVA